MLAAAKMALRMGASLATSAKAFSFAAFPGVLMFSSCTFSQQMLMVLSTAPKCDV